MYTKKRGIWPFTTIPSRDCKMNQPVDLKLLEERLAESDIPIDPTLKRRVYEILSGIQDGANEGLYDMPGMLVVLGYDTTNPIHSDHYSIPDKNQNIFSNEEEQSIDITTEQAKELIHATKEFDGAILINENGYVTDSGIYLRKIDPIDVLEEMEIENDRDLSERFGFFDKVHARHLAAICASHVMTGTTTFTLSQERGVIRVYEAGKILYSQIPDEIVYTPPVGLEASQLTV